MADIIGFPRQLGFARPASRRAGGEPLRDIVSRPPVEFLDQVRAIRTMDLLKFVDYREVPVSPKIADFGLGVEFTLSPAEVDRSRSVSTRPDWSDGLAAASQASTPFGWLTAHFSYRPRPDWDSQWRLVGFLRQPVVEPGEAPFLPYIYGDLLQEILTPLAVEAPSGAISVACDESFGPQREIGSAEPVTSCDIRASWSPAAVDGSVGTAGPVRVSLAAHINVWAQLLLRLAGWPVLAVPRPPQPGRRAVAVDPDGGKVTADDQAPIVGGPAQTGLVEPTDLVAGCGRRGDNQSSGKTAVQ